MLAIESRDLDSLGGASKLRATVRKNHQIQASGVRKTHGNSPARRI